VDEATLASDAVLIVFNALSESEQEEVYERISELRLRQVAGDESTPARYLRSLRRVAEHIGHTPSRTEYQEVSEDLRAAGEDVEILSRLYVHFRSWARAREALALSESSSARAIEARFRHHPLVGKPWRYSDAMLREAMLRCAEDYSHPAARGRVQLVA
jgi:hypothetical protein